MLRSANRPAFTCFNLPMPSACVPLTLRSLTRPMITRFNLPMPPNRASEAPIASHRAFLIPRVTAHARRALDVNPLLAHPRRLGPAPGHPARKRRPPAADRRPQTADRRPHELTSWRPCRDFVCWVILANLECIHPQRVRRAWLAPPHACKLIAASVSH
jgi:hypothetical protein